MLHRMEISGFRSLAEDVNLSIRDELTVLTGENDGGKTASLHAIEALLGERTVDEDDVCRTNDGPVSVVGYFGELGQADELCVRAYKEKDGPFQREVKRRTHAVFGANVNALTVPALKQHMNDQGIALPSGGQLKPDLVTAVETWLETRPDEEFANEWVELDKETAALLPALTSYKATTTADPESHVRTLVSQEVRRLLEDEQFAKRLADVQVDLTAEVDPSLDSLKEKIKAYCPDLDSVEVKAEYDFTQPKVVVQLVLVRNGQEHVLAKSGEGKKRRITLAIHEAGLESLEGGEPTRAELIAYDEPDTNLDYRSQRSLFGILEEQAKLEHVQVVVATHSLNFIDKVPLQSIAHFRLTDGQHTEVEVLSSDAFGDEVDFFGSVCAGLGLRNSVLLDERVFLMLEGETEVAAMPAVFKTITGQSLVSSGVTMFNAQGSGALRKIATALKVEWKRNVIVLLDEDQRAVPATTTWIAEMGLVEGVGLFFVGVKEFEDAFTDQQWVDVLNAKYPPSDGSTWTASDIAGVRGADKFSRELTGLVRAKCGSHLIKKPDLGLAIGEALTDGAAFPSRVRDCVLAAKTAAQ